jgi:LCP family protein required for cell wall assembly
VCFLLPKHTLVDFLQVSMDWNTPSPLFDPDAETQPYSVEETSAPTQPVRPYSASQPDSSTRPILAPQTDITATRPAVMDAYSYPDLFPVVPDPNDQTVAIPSPTQAAQPDLAPVDPGLADPGLADPMSHYQAVPVQPVRKTTPGRKPKRRGCGTGCFFIFLILLGVGFLYFLAPINTTLVLMGIDRSPEGSDASRTDTIILTSVRPLSGQVKLLSIPRDLWVPISGAGENRINTAHFFAEVNQPGSGPQALADTIEQNFGVRVPYTLRVRFDGFEQIIDAMGGVTLNLAEDAGGLSAGENHLTGAEALAFVRDRAGTDDFFRMSHTLTLLNAVIGQALSPATWLRAPEIAGAIASTIDTNLPVWQWPRLGVALARAALMNGIHSQTLDRTMAIPYVTDGGAQVLLPQWDQIQPLIRDFLSGI